MEMTTVKDIAGIMERLAPTENAMDWDNVGLLVGRANAAVRKVLVALDVTAEVVAEAVREQADLIVSHHPVIFRGIVRISDETPMGANLIDLIENKIAVYAAHTNLDVAAGGVNDMLCAKLGLKDAEPLIYEDGTMAIGRKTSLPTPMILRELAADVKQRLGLDAVRICGDENAVVQNVAVCAGAGAKYVYTRQVIAAGCDVYITSDIGYHDAQAALAEGLCMIDATHYASEAHIAETLKDRLDAALAGSGVDVVVSNVDGQVFRTL